MSTAVYCVRSASLFPSNLQFVVVPGNPGIIDFYSSFIEHLFTVLEGKHDVLGIGHAGHNLPDSNGQRFFNLQDQIDHKIAFLEDLRKDNPKVRFVLLGHSVGAYMALKVLHRRPDLPVVQVFPLFPTLCNLWSGLSVSKRMLSTAMLRHSLPSLVRWLPLWAVRGLVRVSGELVEESHYLALEKNLAYSIIGNILHLLHHETVEIGDLDEEMKEVITKHIDKLVFIYGPTDVYAPRESFLKLKDMFSEVDAHLADETIPHAFVVTHYAEVAEMLRPWLNPHLAEDLDNT